jgi:hypothetical protein
LDPEKETFMRGTRLVVWSRFLILILGAGTLIFSSSMRADSGANHQVRNQHFGVSGGNVNDSSRAFCCSGTLGSLVSDGSKLYVLSNNHVLGRSDAAKPGEDISQPGLIDVGCRVNQTTIVADFTRAVKLGNNVDCAIAELRSGTMDATGFIEDVGAPSSTIATPSVGLNVAKSGRTTGFTTGTVGSVNTSVNVQYQKGCGSGKKFVISYTNQVVINSSTFSAGGDSGSLIVTNDSAHHPVALLFAGSSTSTIGNPIGEVLSKLGVSFNLTGAASLGQAQMAPSVFQGDTGPSRERIELATQAMKRRESNLMSRQGVIGVGVGASDDNNTDAAIVIYVDVNNAGATSLPRRINGFRVKTVYTEPFVAY